MNETDTYKKILPMSALDDIPTAKADAKAIVALVKNSGHVTGYQLSDGSEGNNLSHLPSISG